MDAAVDRFDTERLVVRRSTTGDWAAIQVLAADKESSRFAKYDHPWPVSEAGCRQAAEFFATDSGSWAVCLRGDGRLVGFIRFNSIDEKQELDLGHLFLSTVSRDDYATEAIGRMVDHAFQDCGVRSIICHNPDEWTEQLAPLGDLGTKVRGRGKGSLQEDAEGRPIEFTCCTMGLSREEWMARAAGDPPRG